MKITRTITAEVETCTECPFFVSVPDGPYCLKMIEDGLENPYHAMVFPEGRDGIHPNCPFLLEKT